MILDIIIGVALIAAVITGIVRGFVKEISVLAGLIFGFYIASQKYLALEKYLFHSSPVSTTYKVISFIIIFVIVFVVFLLLGLLLRKFIQLIMLGWLDKILGGIFGFIKGLIIIWLILMLVTTILPNTINTISKSKLALQILEYGANFTKLPVKIRSNKKLLTYSVNSYILIQIQKQMPVTG
ncbi:MAG: CvpA family protein [Candidatus Latescibacteria bacterium]|nr:CvpA family protein [Candidatus Latescibacterota bacterium]